MDHLLAMRGMVWAVVKSVCKKIGIYGLAVTGVAALVTDDIEKTWDELCGYFFKSVTDAAREEAGLELDPEFPISDASISAAITMKSGINITSVKSVEVLARDLSAHVSGIIEGHTGVKLTNVLSAEQVKADVVGHAQGVVTQQTGVNLIGAQTLDEIKSRVTKHVETRIVNLAVKHIERAAEEFSNPEASIDELLAMVYRGSEAKELKTTGVALGVAAGIIVRAYSEMSAPIRRRAQAFRRRAQNREAQRRFRERHGLRMRYNKLNPDPPTGGTGGTGG